MVQEETRKPRSKTKMVLIALTLLMGLVLAVSRIMGPGSGPQNQFVTEVRQTALADCGAMIPNA
jgi:hypothetical protein